MITNQVLPQFEKTYYARSAEDLSAGQKLSRDLG
jgi:hypothetical protein